MCYPSLIESGPAKGTLALECATGVYVYTPSGDYSGTDSFTVRITDAGGAHTCRR